MPARAIAQPDLGEELRGLFSRARMPSSPALAARILALLDDPAADVRDFAALLRTDAALAAKLLRTANTAEFVQRNPVTTVERAVSVVGLTRVKSIALGFQLVAHLDQLGGAPFDMRTFWQHALVRACLARTLARRVAPARQEEAFLIGLLADCGVVIAVQLLGPSYAQLCQSALAPLAFFAVEQHSFPYTHVDAIAALADEWRLPEVIAAPLRAHHTPPPLAADGDDDAAQLQRVAYVAGSLRLAGDGCAAAEEHELVRVLRDGLPLRDGDFSAVQRAAAEEFRILAPLYGELLDENADVTLLLSEANRRLAAIAASADERRLNVEEQRDGILREHERLRSALCEYRERAALDPLTNLLNRGALTDAARRLIEDNQDRGTGFGCLFLDVDDFKRLNDTCGHKVGDNVLRAVAAGLERACSGWGEVGRYGGEEFVVLFHSPTPADARQRGEQVVAFIRTIDTTPLHCPGPVTCSLGAAWFGPATAQAAEAVFARADALMYEAKRAGKNQARFAALGEPDPTRVEPGGNARGPGSPPHTAAPDARERLAGVAHRLNAESVGEHLPGHRKQSRRDVVSPCVLHCFTADGVTMRAEPAVTRNISTGGLSLLALRSMIRGEALEVELDRGSSRLFLAGLVSFCRHVEGAVHEIGMQFVKHSVTPILFADVPQALNQLAWLPRAVQTTREAAAAPPGTG